MRVLVTGASSLLGKTVARRLLERGDLVTAYQRRPSGLPVTEHLGAIEDRGSLAAAIAGAEAVVHLAARASATGTWAEFEATNVRGTQNVVDAARAAGVTRFVHVSSPSVSHGGRSLMGTGAEPADPDGARGHYARSKAQGELLALDADADDLSVVAIRPHLIWGPGDLQLVGRIVGRARQGRLAIVGSGCALVDTTYVDNAADALVASLDAAPSVRGRVFVVSNGQPRPVGEMLNRIVLAAGLEPPRLKIPFAVARIGGMLVEKAWVRMGRDDDPPMTGFLAEQLGTAHWFDQRETRSALGWEPVVSLDEGFRRLEHWFAAGGFETTP